jgi:hypothetical protein
MPLILRHNPGEDSNTQHITTGGQSRSKVVAPDLPVRSEEPTVETLRSGNDEVVR